MEPILHKLKTQYNQMGPAEKRVAAYILEHPDEIIAMSITELAGKCGCGSATLTRLSRRLQLDGFSMLKICLSSEYSQSAGIGRDIDEQDSPYAIYQKRILDIADSLHNTEMILDPHQLLLASEAIRNANRIVIFGLGNSAAIAQDAAHKFLRIGLVAQACTDNHMQTLIACHMERGNVAIGISHSGVSRDIIEALGFARACGAATVCITNYGDSPITDVSDIVLHTMSEETKHSILAMSSRIAQLAIFDSIYTYIILHSADRAKQAIFNTEYALRTKKVLDGETAPERE